MTSEAAIQQQIRLEAARLGVRLWRNNCGACTDSTGRLIRYGLGNDSAQLNKRLKSSDLIGFTPVLVTPEMVGSVLPVWTSVECKRPGWRMTPSDERAQAQLAWLNIGSEAGGFCGFAQSVDDFREIVRCPTTVK